MKNLSSTITKISIFVILLTFNLYNSNAQSYTLTDDDVIVENGIIKSCSYDFELRNIIIPEVLDGQTVTGIADSWWSLDGIFYNKGITSAVLPSSLRYIGDYSFYNNNLINIDLSVCASLDSIGENAFTYNSISTLDLSGCTLIKLIGNSAFQSNNITSLNLSGCTALSTIDEAAFGSNKISNLNLSPCTALVSIGESAFTNNQLTQVNLTGCSNLKWIGYRAFFNNYSLSGFNLPAVTYKGTIYNIWKDVNNNSYTAGIDPAIDMNTFYVSLIPYTLTDNDVMVESGIIKSCSYDFELRNIIIPEVLDGQTVTGIADSWWSLGGIFNNKGITSAVLPSSLRYIGDYSFYNNDLINIDLSVCASLDSIGENAFPYNSISTLDLSGCALIKLIGNSAFQSNNITSLNLSGCTALSTIGYGAFYGNKIIDVDLTSCKNLLSIGGYAFSNNPYVHDFALPDPVIPGYFYSNWIDSEGILHDAVDRVSNLTNSFTRIMPEITDVIERYGPTSGNIEIIIAGKNFENQKNNKKILFNGIETLNYNSWSDTLITIVSPPNPEGAAKIEIPLENNIIYSSPKQFYYTDEDVIPVCGNIFGTWEAGSTYLLICNVTIPENNTLIVNEGVKIIAMPEENIHLSCNGILKGNGTYDNPILFTSANKLPGSWKGISINGTNDNCKFKNCIFEYATTAISLYAWAWGCESHRNASEFINCIIRNNSNNAFSCTGEGDLEWGCIPAKTGACSPLIQYCQIYNNGNNGIELEAWDGYKSGGYIGAKIYNNIIYNNRNGIYCQGDDNVEPKIINNVISKNSFAGINSTHNNFDKTDYNIANNIITNNVTGVINEDTTSIILNNNGFWSNTVDVQGEIEDFSNIFENPLFIDFQNNDFNLQPSSPCINSGSNDFVDFETDFAGRIRIYEGLGNDTAKVDIGAYEFGAPCSQIKMDRTICSGDSIQIGDSIFTQTGKYAVKLSNIFGCDSIVNLYLIVNPTHSTNITEAICQGESIQIGDSIFNQTGKYSVRLSNIFGCDSIVNLDLTINEVDASIIQSDNTLMANALNAKYQWLNCTDEFSIIVGETNQSYTATKSGSYAVEVTQDDCTDTSDCFNIIIESIIENNFGSDLILFPNPTEGLISIDLGFFYNNVNTIIKNISGQVISTNNFGFIREFNLSLEGPNGLYIVEISTKEVRKAKIVIVKY